MSDNGGSMWQQRPSEEGQEGSAKWLARQQSRARRSRPIRPAGGIYNVKLFRSPEKLHYERGGIFQVLSLQDNDCYH